MNEKIKTVVITGSTRGIGYGLADALLARGCQVVINGRSSTSVERACARLTAKHDDNRLLGIPADVTSDEDIAAMWQTAVRHFGTVDIWINNAGVGQAMQRVWELPSDTIDAVIDTNLIGTIRCSRIVIPKMLQQGHGHLYNMEGAGSNGRVRPKLIVYSSSKAAVTAFSNGLIAETEETPVKVGTISPGMVVTDLLLDPVKDDPNQWPEAKRIFNILADRVETVTPWIAEQLLADDKHGTRIKWLTTPRLLWRFATAPFRQRSVLTDVTT